MPLLIMLLKTLELENQERVAARQHALVRLRVLQAGAEIADGVARATHTERQRDHRGDRE